MHICLIAVWDVWKGLLSHVFGSKDKEKEQSPLSSFLPLKYKGLRSLQFGRLRGKYTAGGECIKEDASPHFLAGKFFDPNKEGEEEVSFSAEYVCTAAEREQRSPRQLFFSFPCSGMASLSLSWGPQGGVTGW